MTRWAKAWYPRGGPQDSSFPEGHHDSFATLLLSTLALPTAILAQDGAEAADEMAGHTIVTADAVAYSPLEVPGFDPGLELAVLHGDPMGEAGAYTIRLRFSDGYRFPSHWHPNAENLTVLRGSFQLGMGTEEDPSGMQTYAPGSFLRIPAESPHFGAVTGSTEIQLHGEAPFEIVLANTGA